MLHAKLKVIVRDHRKAIDMCRAMSKSLWINVLIHYISAALVTCVCCLMILLAEGAEKLIFVNYIIASTTQVLVYSLGGNFLEDASISVRDAAYDFQWYKCDKRIRKLIQLMMLRAQRKTAVDVPFFEASLETFGAVGLSRMKKIG